MVDLTEKYVGKDLRLNGQLVNPNYAFLVNEIENYDYLVMQGGTRSGKTYSTVEFLWDIIDGYSGITTSIARQSMPTIKGTVLKDFIDIGTKRDLYNLSSHNQTEAVYRQNKNVLSFLGAEDEEKARGRGQDILYANEGPELLWDVFDQLDMRTTGKVIIDYNPSYPDSWIYNNILTRDSCALLKTTYKDNPFVTKKQLAKLEWMKIHDPDKYRIYGLGERGEIKGQIYQNWRSIREDAFPKDANIWVIDFGYSQDPAAISRFKFEPRTIYAREEVYQVGLDNIDLAIHLFFKGANANSTIIADSSEPKSIGELRNGWGLEQDYIYEKTEALGYSFQDDYQMDKLQDSLRNGLTIVGATKGSDSIRNGIQKVKQYEVLLTEDSSNAWSEQTKYKYKEDPHTGKSTKTPIDAHNHFCDTLRYAALSHGRIF
jgi:phage terminase large subunit